MQSRYNRNLDAIKMQLICNLDAIYMQVKRKLNATIRCKLQLLVSKWCKNTFSVRDGSVGGKMI